MRGFVEFGGDFFPAPFSGGRVVHSRGVHTGREQIEIAPKAERGQIAAVTPAPQSDMFCIDIAATLQIFSSGHDVLILRRAASGSAWRFAERAAVANPAAVIERKNDVSAAGEVLIHGVGI